MTKIDHVLLVGPVGSGKTMWARRQRDFTGDPKDTARARRYIQQLYGVSSVDGRETVAPWRAPHHTASLAAMRGTVTHGFIWRPGELNLAHGGTLFLDEVSEFQSAALDCVREAIRTERVQQHGTAHHFTTPARFRLIAAVSPGQLDRVPQWLRDSCRILTPEEWSRTPEEWTKITCSNF